jgi:hypothetical protein
MDVEEEVNKFLYSNSPIFVTQVGQEKTLYFVSFRKDSKAWILVEQLRYWNTRRHVSWKIEFIHNIVDFNQPP